MKKLHAIYILLPLTFTLVGIGFSSWVIGQGNLDKSIDTNVNVGLIETKGFKVTASLETTENKLKFEPEANDDTPPVRWDGVNSEDLNFLVHLQIENGVNSNGSTLNCTKFKFSLTGQTKANDQIDSSTMLDKYVADKKIIVPFTTNLEDPSNLITIENNQKINVVNYVIPLEEKPGCVFEDQPRYSYQIIKKEGRTLFVDFNFYLGWGKSYVYDNPSRWTKETSKFYEQSLTTAKAVSDSLNDLKTNMSKETLTLNIMPVSN